MTRYFFDTEFQDDGRTIDLISIGVISESGREYYAVSSEYDESRADDWLRTRVLAHIPRTLRRKSRAQIAVDLVSFLQPPGYDDRNEFWAWFGAYDWVVLCQLYGRMIGLPPCFPHRCNDLKQLIGDWEGPKQTGTKHNALEDARWVRDCYMTYQRLHPQVPVRKLTMDEARAERLALPPLAYSIPHCRENP